LSGPDETVTREKGAKRDRLAVLVALLCAAIFGGVYFWSVAGNAQTGSVHDTPRRIRGRVVSRYGPVANARVRIAGDEKYALTDRQGRYELATAHLPAQSLKVTAGKDGWFNNGHLAYPVGRAGDIVLNALPYHDDPAYRFISPVTCARCHNKLAQYWNRSKMAHTTSNPKVLSMYYGTDATGRRGIGPGYRRDNPNDGGNCIVCHAPSVAVSNWPQADLKAALWSPRTEWDGISCDYCHKVRKVIEKRDRPSHMAAVFKRQAAARGNSILVFGPYDDVVNAPMAASYSPVFDQARFCATCHNHFRKLPAGTRWDHRKVYTDAEWKGFGLQAGDTLPVQSTYQEWKLWQSSLPAGDANRGKKCQDCHMSWRKEMLPYDHFVVDGMARNMWGTRRSPRNIRPHHFDGGTATQLKTALSLEIEGQVLGKKLIVKAFVTNTNGGHWVPTGETLRSILLVVKATDSKGRALKMIAGPRLPAWAGRGDPAAGNYAGLPGALFARVLKDRNGNLNVPFWKATAIAFDSRIRPKKTVTREFEFALKNPDDEPTAEARLIYRPAPRPLVRLKNWKAEDILITSNIW